MNIVSGIQPTGPLHIGNFLGSLKNFLELQNKLKCFFFTADYHSLTEDFNPKDKNKQILELGAEMLAIGLNPKKCALFFQNQVPEVVELGWIFNCITPLSHLERMTQYKDKAGRQKKNINVGLLDYPVLQAADILIYGKDKEVGVPVGEDQIQHIELTRVIARLFNNRFGKTFKEPKILLTKTPRIMSLLEPTKKMSKSLGEEHCIFLSDEPKVIERKIKRAVTATSSKKKMSPGVKNLFALLENFGAKSDIKKFEKDYKDGTIKYSELKSVLSKRIADTFKDFRNKKKELMKNPKKVVRIFDDGAKDARKIARETIKDVRKKVGLI